MQKKRKIKKNKKQNRWNFEAPADRLKLPQNEWDSTRGPKRTWRRKVGLIPITNDNVKGEEKYQSDLDFLMTQKNGTKLSREIDDWYDGSWTTIFDDNREKCQLGLSSKSQDINEKAGRCVIRDTPLIAPENERKDPKNLQIKKAKKMLWKLQNKNEEEDFDFIQLPADGSRGKTENEDESQIEKSESEETDESDEKLAKIQLNREDDDPDMDDFRKVDRMKAVGNLPDMIESYVRTRLKTQKSLSITNVIRLVFDRFGIELKDKAVTGIVQKMIN
ncbi:MAG: hypothetical protein Ta2E_11310 [Mycoplasmoidaceae bacterium]|nr:MAG: hypothetical protein Ta2E_11310 [Mycoplasmoidaceae bacterium]